MSSRGVPPCKTGGITLTFCGETAVLNVRRYENLNIGHFKCVKNGSPDKKNVVLFRFIGFYLGFKKNKQHKNTNGARHNIKHNKDF